jgi:ribosomal peptide maturation radical SAM protein 1
VETAPIPHYEEFFLTMAQMPWKEKLPIHLPFETSRGCWWGAKKHCTFCGLNGKTMRFRSKSPELAAKQLGELVTRYGRYPVDMTDNIIDFKYFDTFAPTLASMRLGVSLFYEIKANISKAQLASLLGAGIDRVQPGIESLSDNTLRLMRKGVSAMQNILLLKWAKELGIDVSWNYLWGFPNEVPEEYQTTARLLRALTHLPPPSGGGCIRLDRFSPYHENPSAWGLIMVAPYESYKFVYQLPDKELKNIAYYFTFQYSDGRPVDVYTAALKESLHSWMASGLASELVFARQGDEGLLIDTRPEVKDSVFVLDSKAIAVLTAAQLPAKKSPFCERIAQNTGSTPHSIQSVIEALLAKGILIEVGEQILNVAMDLHEYRPKQAGLDSIFKAIKAASVMKSDGESMIMREEHLLRY